jgi:hypothetical protein
VCARASVDVNYSLRTQAGKSSLVMLQDYSLAMVCFISFLHPFSVSFYFSRGPGNLDPPRWRYASGNGSPNEDNRQGVYYGVLVFFRECKVISGTPETSPESNVRAASGLRIPSPVKRPKNEVRRLVTGVRLGCP